MVKCDGVSVIKTNLRNNDGFTALPTYRYISFSAICTQFNLIQIRVAFDLVCYGTNTGTVQNFLDLGCVEIGNSNHAGEPTALELFHLPPNTAEMIFFSQQNFVVFLGPKLVGMLEPQRPMNEVKIDVGEAEIYQGFLQSFLHSAPVTVVSAPQLARDEQIFSTNCAVLNLASDRLADFFFVLVNVSTVQMSVPNGNGTFHSF